MTNREAFIAEIMTILEVSGGATNLLSQKALAYWGELGNNKVVASEVTENGAKVLEFMLNNEAQSCDAKTIATALFISPRAASGIVRKLVADGYLNKEGQSPVMYSLTDAARAWKK